jgi:hypothetical protein
LLKWQLMRKRMVTGSGREGVAPGANWLDLEQLATVEVTSEDPSHPVELALSPGIGAKGFGWRAAQPGEQTVRLIFDQPQELSRIWLSIREPEAPRTQEFVLRWSPDGGRSFQEVVRQQWNFDPRGSTLEVEDYSVHLRGVTVLELTIMPDKSGSEAFASVAQWRLA